MNEKLKEIFIKQMLLPKEELAMQTMELLADKMDLQSKIDKAIEWIEQYEKQIGTLGETSKSIVLTDDVVIGSLLDVLKEDK